MSQAELKRTVKILIRGKANKAFRFSEAEQTKELQTRPRSKKKVIQKSSFKAQYSSEHM